MATVDVTMLALFGVVRFVMTAVVVVVCLHEVQVGFKWGALTFRMHPLEPALGGDVVQTMYRVVLHQVTLLLFVAILISGVVQYCGTNNDPLTVISMV